MTLNEPMGVVAVMKALSIKQPWAWLIVNGFKDIENRNWHTNYRGPVLIHAGKKPDGTDADMRWLMHDIGWDGDLPRLASLEYGGIVGEAEIVDCVHRSQSPWFFGKFGFVIRNARPLPFRPCKGQLGFFEP